MFIDIVSASAVHLSSSVLPYRFIYRFRFYRTRSFIAFGSVTPFRYRLQFCHSGSFQSLDFSEKTRRTEYVYRLMYICIFQKSATIYMRFFVCVRPCASISYARNTYTQTHECVYIHIYIHNPPHMDIHKSVYFIAIDNTNNY